jgi:serralysin
MKTEPKTTTLRNITLALALLLGACQSAPQPGSPPAACRNHSSGQAAPYAEMCSAQNFRDLPDSTGKLMYDEKLPVKRAVKKSGTEAAILLHYRWLNGTQLRVKFLNNPYGLKDRVLAIANEWHARGHANISFVETNAADSDIRVTFLGSGYWSVIGTQARQEQGHATLCLAFGGVPSATELHRVAAHEFGHAIGLIHEQAQPAANIHWDAKACYLYFGGPPNCWSKEMVDSNVLRHQPESPEIAHTLFDEDSIMEYAVDPKLTTDGHGIGWNTDLSPLDCQFVAKVYPMGNN